ncbi:hypothetical protein LQ948_17370 [Jiella sp. MQZ9-1]|uniref:DUF2232 domain-containing protein n=1 Tax=Jiella flava TaxID=2816857 RepID=A0A939G254_9HYPH|nr:hypothetical protein [Jiella flava]MBO0664346.1 hypothetical protein [Jiella flava]MCD2472982.1 hypothetical protein [Jiella flava]
MTPSKLLIAIAAGAASALLFAGVVLQSGSAVTLALAAPIPIFIASLGWGSLAGGLAAVIAAVVVGAISGAVSGGILMFAAIALPAAIAGHLAGLAKPAPELEAAASRPFPSRAGNTQPTLIWFPVEHILFAIALMATLACLGLGWYFGYDIAALKPEIVAALRQGDSSSQISGLELDAVAGLLLSLVPLVQPAVLTLTLAVGLYLAAWITRISDRLQRPRDDLPTAVHLPPVALVLFAGALAASFVGGTVELVALVVCGAFGMAFTLVGLARLHARTRGRSNRGLLLFVAYAAIVILSFPLIVFTAFGIYDTLQRMRPSPPA